MINQCTAALATGTKLHLHLEKSPAKGFKTSVRNLGRNENTLALGNKCAFETSKYRMINIVPRRILTQRKTVPQKISMGRVFRGACRLQ